MWTRTPTKAVSNFSPTSFSKSHRSMLKALRIPTSTAALRRRLVQDEGENIPPLTFSSYKTQAKDYPFLSSVFLPVVWNSHWLQSTTDMKNFNQAQSLHCFWKLQLFFFPFGGVCVWVQDGGGAGILWIFQHLISVGDMDGTAQRDSFFFLFFF